jgi:hypothetical protein
MTDTDPGVNVNINQLEPVPVKLTDEDVAIIRGSNELTPVFGGWSNFVLTGIAAETAPQPILPTDLKRIRAYIQVNSVPPATIPGFQGSITSPAANASVVLIGAIGALPPPGIYTVNWTVELDGTVSASDLNNFKLSIGSTVLENSINDAAIGRYPQLPVTLTIPPGNASNLTVKAIAVGTVGAIYSAEVTLTAVQQFNGFIAVGQLGQVSNGQGARIYANSVRWEIRAHSMLYAAGDGQTPLNVIVYAERNQGE